MSFFNYVLLLINKFFIVTVFVAKPHFPEDSPQANSPSRKYTLLLHLFQHCRESRIVFLCVKAMNNSSNHFLVINVMNVKGLVTSA